MKHLLLLFSFFAIITCSAQTNVTVQWSPHIPQTNGDTIYYDIHKKLIWPDFKAKTTDQTNAIAETYSGFGYNLEMRGSNGRVDIGINVYCYFTKSNSWVKDGRTSDYVLSHEQHHFDITYIITNMFVNKLKATNLNKNNFSNVTAKIYYDCLKELQKMQDDYDGQTHNGQLKDVQAMWNDKINNQLLTLPTN